jgi:cellulose synthase/poly-beta-1,6-N-acetylglucosamine synthase-like glycosyltransferase
MDGVGVMGCHLPGFSEKGATMIDLLLIPITLLYLSVVGMLFVYGVNFFYLTFIMLRSRPQAGAPPEPDLWPKVTVQLPIYNELYVTKRLVEAAVRLDYPASSLEIQVLDDSCDETAQIAHQLVENYQARGVNIMHIHRPERQGFKAGALANGLKLAKGEFIAIFDADFIPPADFLKSTIPYFADEQLAFIQTRWDHTNRDYSLFTYLQSLAIDAHFVVEQYARFVAGYWFNFNGTAGIWRRSAIEHAGGWQADTLTEDLDISYRAFLRGWKAHYLRRVAVPGELPVSFSAYRRQQHRWARGSLECALKFLPTIWSSRISIFQKLQSSLHLTGYGVHLLLFLLGLLYPAILAISVRYPQLISLFNIAFLFNATAFAPTVFFLASQHQLGRVNWRKLPTILFVSIFGTGMMVNTLRAAWHAFTLKKRTFERTPKYGISLQGQAWLTRRYQLRLDGIVSAELAFAAVNLGTVFLAITMDNWVIALYAGIFAAGLSFTAGVSILQSIAIRRKHAVRLDRREEELVPGDMSVQVKKIFPQGRLQ